MPMGTARPRPRRSAGARWRTLFGAFRLSAIARSSARVGDPLQCLEGEMDRPSPTAMLRKIAGSSMRASAARRFRGPAAFRGHVAQHPVALGAHCGAARRTASCCRGHRDRRQARLVGKARDTASALGERPVKLATASGSADALGGRRRADPHPFGPVPESSRPRRPRLLRAIRRTRASGSPRAIVSRRAWSREPISRTAAAPDPGSDRRQRGRSRSRISISLRSSQPPLDSARAPSR